MRASTVSEETVGDGAMTTSGSPSNVSSQRMCRWIRTDWKHLSTGQRSQVTGQREEKVINTVHKHDSVNP